MKYSFANRLCSLIAALIISSISASCDIFYEFAGNEELRNLLNNKNDVISPNFPQRIAITEDAECLVDFQDSGTSAPRVICKGGIYGSSFKEIIKLPEQAGEIKALSMTDQTVCVMWAESASDFYFQCEGELTTKQNTFFEGISDEGRSPEKLVFYDERTVILDYVGHALLYSNEESAHRFDLTNMELVGAYDEIFCVSVELNLSCGELDFNSSSVLELQSPNVTMSPFSFEKLTVSNEFSCGMYTATDPVEQKIQCSSLSDSKLSTGVTVYDSLNFDIKSSENIFCIKFSHDSFYSVECADPQEDIEGGSEFEMDHPIFENKTEITDFAVDDQRVCIIENNDGKPAYECESR